MATVKEMIEFLERYPEDYVITNGVNPIDTSFDLLVYDDLQEISIVEW